MHGGRQGFLEERIARDVLVALTLLERERSAPWAVLPSLGVRISETNRPEPDLVILPRTGASLDLQGRDRDDPLAAFEVLSPSTEDRDLRWKRKAYARLPSLMYYVVIAQDVAEVLVYARALNFAEQRLESIDATLDLLAASEYVADRSLATVLFLALSASAPDPALGAMSASWPPFEGADRTRRAPGRLDPGLRPCGG